MTLMTIYQIILISSMKKIEKTYSLYRHTSPSGKVYIGITSQPVEHRWNSGKGYMNSSKGLFKSTIIKYGWDNIKHEVLFTKLSKERAIHLEKELIRHYKALGISLNLTDGGEGCWGCTPWNKGKKVPYEKSNKRKGCHLTEEHKNKLSIAHKGKHLKGHRWTESQREKLMLSKTNYHPSDKTKRKIKEHSARARRVLELDALGNIIKIFASASDAGKYYNIDGAWVSRACRKNLMCKGHYFIYDGTSVDISNIRYGRYKAGKAITIESVSTGERKEFFSLAMCARFLGYKSTVSLHKAIKNNYIKNGWKIAV